MSRVSAVKSKQRQELKVLREKLEADPWTTLRYFRSYPWLGITNPYLRLAFFVWIACLLAALSVMFLDILEKQQ